MVREPQDSAVSGWVRIVSACRTACFRGPIRKSNTEIGFGTRRTLESVCVRLRGWSVMINEPRHSAVSGWMRVVIVCRSDATRGPVRRSGLEIGFGPALQQRPVRRSVGSWSGNRGIQPFPDGCGLCPHTVMTIMMDWFGNRTLKSDSVQGEHWNQCASGCADGR